MNAALSTRSKGYLQDFFIAVTFFFADALPLLKTPREGAGFNCRMDESMRGNTRRMTHRKPFLCDIRGGKSVHQRQRSGLLSTFLAGRGAIACLRRIYDSAFLPLALSAVR